MQKTDLVRHCEAHNLDYDIFEDKASGRSTRKRPGLDKVMDGVRKGVYSTVLVWKIDRFARNMRDFLNLYAEIDGLGVKFVSHVDHLDFSTPIGRLIAQLLASFAEFESANISHRVKSGMAEKKRNGKTFGVKPMKFPYKKALDLKQRGYTYKEIAEALDIGRTSVCKYLSKPEAV